MFRRPVSSPGPCLCLFSMCVTVSVLCVSTERAEVSLVCSEEAGAGRLVFRHHEQQLVQLALETAVVCPVRQVECQVSLAVCPVCSVRLSSVPSAPSVAWIVVVCPAFVVVCPVRRLSHASSVPPAGYPVCLTALLYITVINM